MVESLLEFMLGPMEHIGDFYYEYQHIFNPVVITLALLRLWVVKNKGKEEAQ